MTKPAVKPVKKKTKFPEDASDMTRYLLTHGVQPWNHGLSTDPTRAWLLDSKGNRVCKNMTAKSGYNFSHWGEKMFWLGWKTRLDRIGRIAQKARKAQQAFSKIVRAEIVRLLNGKTAVKVYNLIPYGEHYALTYVEIRYEAARIGAGDENGKEISWSSNNHLEFHNSANQTIANKDAMPWYQIIQCAGWNDIVKAWDTEFFEGRYLAFLFRMDMAKHRRYQVAYGTLLALIEEKLAILTDKYKVGDLVQMEIAGETHRYERVDPQTNRAYIKWSRISGNPVQNIDISGILEEDPHAPPVFKDTREHHDSI